MFSVSFCFLFKGIVPSTRYGYAIAVLATTVVLSALMGAAGILFYEAGRLDLLIDAGALSISDALERLVCASGPAKCKNGRCSVPSFIRYAAHDVVFQRKEDVRKNFIPRIPLLVINGVQYLLILQCVKSSSYLIAVRNAIQSFTHYTITTTPSKLIQKLFINKTNATDDDTPTTAVDAR
uniref:Uncharacterized protein n=1 Tax=Glossina pallidipes TaxID=7398 RepID=A0A1B0A2E7_GLOPL